MSVKCTVCKDTGWVCENHNNLPWGKGPGECDCGAGMPCRCIWDLNADITNVITKLVTDQPIED